VEKGDLLPEFRLDRDCWLASEGLASMRLGLVAGRLSGDLSRSTTRHRPQFELKPAHGAFQEVIDEDGGLRPWDFRMRAGQTQATTMKEQTHDGLTC